MKVLLTTPYYPPHIGGIEIHTANIARGMEGTGYEVEVVTATGSDERVNVKVRMIN